MTNKQNNTLNKSLSYVQKVKDDQISSTAISNYFYISTTNIIYLLKKVIPDNLVCILSTVSEPYNLKSDLTNIYVSSF